MMPSVRLLDEQTANQIAAGEVVERPAAAIKELVENSLDAGATRILVEVEDGGRALLRVTDNGIGMTPEDAEMALQRHATSKITSADDLTRLRTLGFRGEALPSIASVSHFEMVTRPPDAESALRLFLEGGRNMEKGAAGAPPGTRITVRHLFFNTPARLKFIKSVTTEFNHIAEIAGRLAMAHAGVAIRLMHNNREVFSTPGTGDPRDALAALWGRDRAASLLYAESDLPAATVTGYVSPPEQSRPNRGQQAFFVNGRPIVSRLLAHALDQTFRPLIPDGRFAAAALFLEVPSEDVDVNVHPSKTEVRFRSEREVHSAISRAVRSALLLTPSVSRPETEETPPSPSVGLLRPLSAERPTVPVQQFLPESLMRGVPPSEEAWEDPFAAPAQSSTMPLEREAGGERPELDVEPTPPIETAPTAPLPEDTGAQPLLDAPPPNFAANRAVVEMLSRTRLLGQVMNTFLVGEGPDGIVLIDQHVAHERILYDRLVRTREGRAKMEIQRLLIPLTITLSGREAAALETRLSELEAFGFDIESYSGGTFLVRALPADLSHRNPEAILRDLAADLNEEWGSQRTVMEKAIDAVLASASCHGAIKANMPLGPAEMKRLVDDLMRTDDPFHCPHGRPIIVKITAAELFKWFKRTG